jgi:hypothetical protein
MSINSVDALRTGSQTRELERLLSLAEELYDRCRQKNRSIEFYIFLQAICGGVVGFFLLSISRLGIILFGAAVVSNWCNWLVPLSFFCFVGMAAIVYLVRRRRKSLRPDETALAELVELIQETESAVAASERWSTLERAQFRIRLSRLETGTK